MVNISLNTTKWTMAFHLNSLNIRMTTAYDVGNPDKSVNGILTQPSLNNQIDNDNNMYKHTIKDIHLLYLSCNFLYRNQLDSFTIFPGLCREVYFTGQ